MSLLGLIEAAYRSRLGRAMSWVARGLAVVHRPRMIYGYRDPRSGRFRKYTRVSSSAVILGAERLSVAEHVWIGHFNVLDATFGMDIMEGVQLAAHVMVFTHGSQDAIRLLGRSYVDIAHDHRGGYTRGSVRIGPFTFVGAGAIVLPGTTLGKGCLVATGAVVNRDLADYSVAQGIPAKVVGDTRDMDARFLAESDFGETYYDPQGLAEVRRRAAQLSRL